MGIISSNYTQDSAIHEPQPLPPVRNKWYYPPDLSNDLQDLALPKQFRDEILACAWEYTRCVIPQYTNWPRYVAFMRVIAICVVAEFRGSLVDMTVGDDVLGYNLDELLDTLFLGTPDYENMCRELRCCLLITSDKSSEKRNGELFRRYVNAIAHSPRQWFRMRDTDALARFTIAAALTCNDLNDAAFSDAEYEILTEIADTLYDAVAFFKHRSEGETNNTFAYMPEDSRVYAFHQAREVLWAIDVAFAARPEFQHAVNFVRAFGGSIHMMMRRYRFVDDGLSIGKAESKKVVDATRKNFKLWNRLDRDDFRREDEQRYRELVTRGSENLMFPGLAEMLQNESTCPNCGFRDNYGAESMGQFGGVRLCSSCKRKWVKYLLSLSRRTGEVFPEVTHILSAQS